MASRIVFLPTDKGDKSLFKENLIEFEWVPGMAISQGTKSVNNLHASAKERLRVSKILEISTRSQEPLGIHLSAFNLKIVHAGRNVSVEVAYQSSKIFENGGPFIDLLASSSMDAKQDPRLKNSGRLIGFEYQNQRWPLAKTPNFYDFLYIQGLLQFEDRDLLIDYDAFTDIAFSQITLKQEKDKSFNCQARSAAIYVSLTKRMDESKVTEFLVNEAFKTLEGSEQLDLFLEKN